MNMDKVLLWVDEENKVEIINEFELEKMIELEEDYTDRITDITDEPLKKALVYYDFLSNNIENL